MEPLVEGNGKTKRVWDLLFLPFISGSNTCNLSIHVSTMFFPDPQVKTLTEDDAKRIQA